LIVYLNFGIQVPSCHPFDGLFVIELCGFIVKVSLLFWNILLEAISPHELSFHPSHITSFAKRPEGLVRLFFLGSEFPYPKLYDVIGAYCPFFHPILSLLLIGGYSLSIIGTFCAAK
jgi:hypothetical protein